MVEATVAAATLTIGATAYGALYREIRLTRRQSERNNTLLEGLDESEAHPGLVNKVQRHEEALEDEGLLDESTERRYS